MEKMEVNPQQKKAIQYGKGPLLIVAGAGTGKTTVITERIRFLINDKKVKPKEILALAFTEKAAGEMLNRVDEVMPLGYEEPWLSTFHSFAQRILESEALEIGLDPSFKILSEPQQWLLIRNHLFEFDLKHYRPLGNPTKFISALLQLFSRAKDEIVSADDFLKYANSKKAAKIDDEGTIEDKEKLLELANAYKKYQELLIAENAMDFGDLLLWVIHLFKTRPSVLKKYQQQFQYILVDEFQDTNIAQFEIIKLLAPVKTSPHLVVVGDDDQCLPAGTLIYTKNGSQKIETLKQGESVLCGVGRGQVSLARINRVLKSTKRARILTIKTASGHKIVVTDNHKMFCFINPNVSNQKRWYVYLMEQKNLGWRVGVTKNLAIRSRFERQVDRVFGIGSFATIEEAKYHEILYSLKYQIPTVTFTARQKQVIKDKLLNNLMSAIDTEAGAKRLAGDLNLDLNSHHFSPGGVVRGNTHRIKISLIMCQKRYKTKNARNRLLTNPQISHVLSLETSDKKVIKKLENAGFKLQKAKVGKRFRLQSQDISLLGKVLKRIEKTVDAITEVKCQIGKIGEYSRFASVIPATNLLVGIYLPVLKNNEILYDQIVDIKKKESLETVYDLEIDRTHNYIANGVVVHNSIFKFRGASISNILEFKKEYPKAETVVLTQNYRSTQKILDSAYRLIQNNNPDRLEKKLKIDKHLTSVAKKTGSSPLILPAQTSEEEADQVTEQIAALISSSGLTYADFAILARANSHLDAFVASLRRKGIPYSLVGNRGLFDQEEIRSLISFLRFLVNREDNVSLYQLILSPVFSFTPKEITFLLTKSHENRISLWQVVNETEKTSKPAETLVSLIKTLEEKVHSKTVSQILYEFLISTGFIKSLLTQETVENALKIKNINLFFEKVKNFETQSDNPTVFEFVDYLELLIEAGENPAQAEIEDIDTVKLLTIHSAKGLEFPVVFLVNLVVDRFPSRERKDALPLPDDLVKEILSQGEYHVQEERRLFYVGLTRARDLLFLTWAKNYGGVREKKPSGFLNEVITDNPSTTLRTSSQDFQLSLLTDQTEDVLPLPKKLDLKPLSSSRISFSQLETYRTCPLKYYYKYVLHVTGIPNSALNFGQALHRTLRDFHKADLFSQNKTIDDLLRFYKNHFTEMGQGYTSVEHRLERYKQGQEILEKYYKKYQTLFGKPVFLEQRFTVKVGEILLIGAIDRIDQYEDKSFEVIDYKTGDSEQKEKKIDKDEQLTIYALAAHEALGINPAKYTLYFLENDVKASTERSEDQITKQKEEINNIVSEIKTNKFPAKVGIWCKWCEFNKICPAYRIGQNNF